MVSLVGHLWIGNPALLCPGRRGDREDIGLSYWTLGQGRMGMRNSTVGKERAVAAEEKSQLIGPQWAMEPNSFSSVEP